MVLEAISLIANLYEPFLEMFVLRQYKCYIIKNMFTLLRDKVLWILFALIEQ